jgi:glutaredoxin
MKTDAGVLAVLLGGVLFASPALADIYTWVDKDGTVHFQEEPPAADVRARKVRTLPDEPPRTEPPAAETAPPRDAGARRGAPAPVEPGQARLGVKPRPAPVVDLFTTSWCPWCKKARDYFNGRGIRFTEHDIDRDAAALKRKVGIDGDRRVPTAVIDGKVVRGYSPSAYQAALEPR